MYREVPKEARLWRTIATSCRELDAQELDLAVLTEVVEHRLEDLLEFTDWILRLEDRKEKEEETP